MPRTRDKMMALHERRAARYAVDDGLTAYLTGCEGLRLARDTIVYSRGEHHRKAAESDNARDALISLLDVAEGIFDPVAWESTEKLITKLGGGRPGRPRRAKKTRRKAQRKKAG